MANILGYFKDGTPILPLQKGLVYTRAMIMCTKCNATILHAGGPAFGSVCLACYKPEEKVVERDIHGQPVNTDAHNELWGSDPNCIHDIQGQPRGGVKCVKCGGWFCY